MPSITYDINVHKNEGLVISPEELLTLYFYGIDVKAKDGSELSYNTIKTHILHSQNELEKILDIRFGRKFMEETLSYNRDDYWQGFPILQTKLPVAKPLSFLGYLNWIEQIKYPLSWCNIRKDKEGHYYRKIHLVPTGSTVSRANSDIILTGITAYLGLSSYGQVPNYFTVQYITGYSYTDLPGDLMSIIGKIAAIQIFALMGDIILGKPGITGLSLGIDGLSQSINTTLSSGSTAFSGRIKQYSDEIDKTLLNLKSFYKHIVFSVL